MRVVKVLKRILPGLLTWFRNRITNAVREGEDVSQACFAMGERRSFRLPGISRRFSDHSAPRRRKNAGRRRVRRERACGQPPRTK